jgi:hypothetical protein
MSDLIEEKNSNTELPDLEKITEKILKLFSLSQSPNEAEALAAFSKAQEMLTRHNLWQDCAKTGKLYAKELY